MTSDGGARVSILLGKGGVGKTAISAAFACDRARAGERVLLMSLTSADELASRVRAEGGGELPPNLEIATLDPRVLVNDIVRKITHLGPIGDVIVRQPGYESLVDIAPGIKEMAVLNRVWNLRSGSYDRIVLDGPATGHGLHFLEAPKKTAAILVGKLRERAVAVQRMLRDAQASEVIIVTLPEEMPVREAVELAEVLKREGFPLDNIVVNKWFPRVFENEGARRVLAALESDAAARRELGRGIAHRTRHDVPASQMGDVALGRDARPRIDVDEWVRAVALIRTERQEALAHLRELRRIGAKLALVPYFPEEERRLARIAAALAEPPAEEAVA